MDEFYGELTETRPVKPTPKDGDGFNEIFWEDPVSFDIVNTPDIPADLLPSWLGDHCKAVSDNTQTPEGLAVMIAISTVATCLQKKFEVSPYGDDYREPLQIWTVTISESGTRKTAVVDKKTGPLCEWEKEQGEKLKEKIRENETVRAVNLKAIERLQTAAARKSDPVERDSLIADINKLKEETPEPLRPLRLWTGDCTPERLQSLMAENNERMALISDEGGIFEIMAGLYSDGKANLDVFLQSHAGHPVRVDRGGRTVHMDRPALTFGLAVQPEVLTDLGRGNKKRFRGIGALPRFLYCIPKSNIGKRDVTKRNPIPETVKLSYRNGIFQLLNIPLDEKPRILNLECGALKKWMQFSQFVESNQGEGNEFESIQDWTSKLPGVALRIAGLFHVVEFGESDLQIKQPTMEKSLDLCELLIKHAQAAFDMIGTDQATDDAKHIYKWIARGRLHIFRRRECQRALHGRFRQKDRLVKALDILHGMSVISEVDSVKVENSTKPLLVYHVNPKLFQGGAYGLA